MRSLVIIVLGLFCTNLYAQQNISVPQMVETQCMGCHSDSITNAPMISGQSMDFLEFELFNFRDYIREHEIMNQVMEDFSAQEVKEIAAYISSLPRFTAEVDEHPDADMTQGEKIFKVSCFQCHKKDTSGTGPLLHGQRTGYLENAIKSFQSTWYAPRPSRVNMRIYADMLTEQDIIDVSAYLNSVN
jgi:cytochrome c553